MNDKVDENKIDRLKSFKTEREERMEKLIELSEQVKAGKGYMIGMTILTKTGELKHSLITDNFPKVDMLKAHSKVEGLIVEGLKEDNRDIGKELIGD